MRKITNFLGAMLLLSFFSFNLSAQDCEGFTVLPAAICSPGNDAFNVLLVFDGADGVTITDNSTGSGFTTGANSITFGPIMSGTGYSFTVAPEGLDGCVEVVSQTVVDCNVTAVELIRFEGIAEAQGNLIEWATASESDVNSFIVEYSTNGFDFEKVGTVEAAGNSNTVRDYSFLHATEKTGVNYYRLLEETTAGLTTVVSSVIGIDRTASVIQIADISPVPAVDFVNVEFIAQANQVVTVDIVDVTGRIVNTNSNTTVEGSNTVTLDVAELAIGTYFVTVSDGTQSMIGKFVKN